jgi:MSHA pilin protein MshC
VINKRHLNLPSKFSGFTLIELIVVFLVMGILVAAVLPRININEFRQTGGVQQGMGAIRFAQKMAITTGCQVDVVINNSTCTLNWNGCTTDAIPNPATGASNFCQESNPGVSPQVSFSFNNIGAPISGQQTINFGNGRTINVEANTGFAYE